MLELKNISWEIPDGDKILKGIDLEIPDGKMTVITGPNGGGKSTLLKTMLHLLTPTKGRVRYFNGDEEVVRARLNVQCHHAVIV